MLPEFFSRSERRALLFAAALSFVFAARVYIAFDAVRLKLVERPLAPVSLVVAIPVAPRGPAEALSAPVALIARIQNDEGDAALFTLRVDGSEVCRRSVRGGAVARIDCAAGVWRPDVPHRIDVAGPSSSWTLQYFEASTHHGATRAHDLLIAPRGARYDAPSWMLIAAVAIVLACAFLVAPAPLARTVVRIHTAGCGLIAVALALVVASPLVSPYVLLISWPSFVAATAFILAPRSWTAARYVVGQWAVGGQRPIAMAAVCAAVVLAVYGAVVARYMREQYGGNYSGFIQLSLERFNRDPMLKDRSDVRNSLILWNNGGYDSQFMYFEIHDPFLRQYSDRPGIYGEYIDSPPYRYGRIGFPLLAKIFAADRWQLYPAAMTWLILGALALCGLVLSLIARANGGNAALGLAVIAIPGFWTSLQCSLPEPIAAALLVSGYWFFLRGRLGWSSAAFALSLVVRETGAVLVVALAVALAMSRGWKTGFAFAAGALAPIVLWRLYVAWILFPVFGREALLSQTDVVPAPFVGLADLWMHVFRGEYFPGMETMARAGFLFPLLIAGGFTLAIAFALVNRGPLSVAAVVYGTMAISLKYPPVWSHVMNGQRTTYEMFVALALLTVGIGGPPRVLRAALIAFWIGAAVYVFYGGFDAEYIRDAVFRGLL